MPLKPVECEALVSLRILDILLVGNVPPAGPHHSRPGVEHHKVRSLNWKRILRDTLCGDARIVDVDYLKPIIVIVKRSPSEEIVKSWSLQATFLLSRHAVLRSVGISIKYI